MNKVELIGRLTRAIEVRYSTGENQMAIGRVNLAVNRKGKKDEADFISLVVFGKTAEAMEKYTDKGSRVGVAGHIQTGSYVNKDGVKVYTTDVIVDDVEFIDFKGDGKEQTPPPVTDSDGFMNIPEGINEDLPFAHPSR